MSRPSSPPNALPRPHLLFVEHSRLIRKAAERILGKEFEVVLSETCEAAWTTLLDNPLIQVIFVNLDESAPQSQPGPDLLERIRTTSSRRISETPVVVITGDQVSESRREEWLDRGVTDFIEKPFRPSELLARARTHASGAVALERLKLLQLQHNRDGETGLGNRRYFFERLGQAISFSHRHELPLSLVHMHLDGLAGTLQNMERPMRLGRMVRFGRMLGRAVRQEDTVYRTGPETFSFILPNTDANGAEAVRCRLVPELDALGMLDGGDLTEISTRFHVEEVHSEHEEPVSDVVRRIRQNMGALLIIPSEEITPTGADALLASPSDHLESLLELVEQGEAEQLKAVLPEIFARLKPLLSLAESMHEKNQDGDKTGQ